MAHRTPRQIGQFPICSRQYTRDRPPPPARSTCSRSKVPLPANVHECLSTAASSVRAASAAGISFITRCAGRGMRFASRYSPVSRPAWAETSAASAPPSCDGNEV